MIWNCKFLLIGETNLEDDYGGRETRKDWEAQEG